MSLLTARTVKNSHIKARVSFIFLKNILKQTWKPFNTKFQPQWKYSKSSYQVRKILVFFCNSVALILGYNCVKCLRVIKIVKGIKFADVWAMLEAKKCLQKQSFIKYLRPTLVFMQNSAQRENFNFSFSRIFC